MKWELAIACRDEVEPHRKKEGDLIAYKPYPWQWGKKEVGSHLFVVVDGLTEDEISGLCTPQRADGLTRRDLDKIALDHTKTVKGTVFENELFGLPDSLIVAKRRYKIPLEIIKDGWFPFLDFDRVRDITDEYQPFKDLDVSINFNEKVAICFDKHLGKYRYSQRKVI